MISLKDWLFFPLFALSTYLSLPAYGGDAPTADQKNADAIASKAIALLADQFTNFKSIPYIHCTYTKVFYLPFFVNPQPEGFGIIEKQDFRLDAKERMTKFSLSRDKKSLEKSLALTEPNPTQSPFIVGLYENELRNYDELFTSFSSERFNRDTGILSIRKATLSGAPKPDSTKPVSLDMQLYKSGKMPPILFPFKFLGRQGNRLFRESFQWHFLLDNPLLLTLAKNSVTKIEEREPGKVQVLYSSITEEIYSFQKKNKVAKDILPRRDVLEIGELGIDKKVIEEKLAARKKEKPNPNTDDSAHANVSVLVFLEKKEEFNNKWLITKYEMRDLRDDELLYMYTIQYRTETIQGKSFFIPSKISQILQGSFASIKNNIGWTISLDQVDREPVDKSTFGIDSESARKIYDENANMFLEGENGK